MDEKHLVEDNFINFWQQNNFQKEKRHSVIPPKNWTITLFVNSGLIRYIELMEKTGILNPAIASCQPCIKIGSGKLSLCDMMLRDGYFTFFEQLTCGADANTIPMKWFVEKVYNYLILITKLLPDKIHVGVHFSQKTMVDYWIKAGLSKQNITYPDTGAFVLNLPERNINGIYSPFYFDRGIDHPLSCQKSSCSINCSCGRFLELGDIGLISIGGKQIIDHGIGLERITSVQMKTTRVTDISEFQTLISLAKEEFGANNIYSTVLADHLRSSIILLSAGIKPGNKKRDYVLRNLIRRTLWAAFGSASFDQEKIVRIYSRAIIEMRKYHPALVISNDIISEIDKEAKKYGNLIARGKDILKRHLRTKGLEVLSEENLLFFYETHGLPEELTEILWEELR